VKRLSDEAAVAEIEQILEKSSRRGEKPEGEVAAEKAA
jgi:hypothetical protein